MENMHFSCPKHAPGSYGFAFLCAHLASGTGSGFNPVHDVDEEDEPRPPVLCDICKIERERTGGYQSSRVCAACYDEIKAKYLR